MAEELTAEVDRLVFEGLEIIDSLYEQISDLDVEYQYQMQCALYYISMQHSVGALMLLKGMAHAPAFALARPIFETYVRATWLHVIATAEEKEAAERDRFPKLGRLVGRLSATSLGRSIVSRYQGASVLHSLTHGGTAQIYGHIQSPNLAPSFGIGEQKLLVDWAVRTAITSAMQTAMSIGRDDLARSIHAGLSAHYQGRPAAE